MSRYPCYDDMLGAAGAVLAGGAVMVPIPCERLCDAAIHSYNA